MATSTTADATLAARIARRIPDPPAGIEAHRGPLSTVAARIVERFQPRQIVLYGSRVYGVPTTGSDADLMVIMETDAHPTIQAKTIRDDLDALLTQAAIAIDIKVRTPRQIRIGLDERDFFIEDVMLSGVSLYARGPSIGKRKSKDGADAFPWMGRFGMKRSTQEWIAKAEIDYASAKRLLAPPDPLLETSSFHAQQAAEKYLKALLQEDEVPFPKTHDLRPLFALLGTTRTLLAPMDEELSWLSKFAVDIREPGALAQPEDADRAPAIATTVRAAVRGELGLAEEPSR